ncbi:MAG TPA: hypothetical protein VM077_03335 [Candidatus Limnocylindrales bacterium]|nr:hypothetical protein [Candidatus Limnocylindrales bacterium]
MKLLWLIILLFVIVGGGFYLTRNLPKMNLTNLMPFPKASIIPKINNTDKNSNLSSPVKCSGTQLPASTEGPYYKPGSPNKYKIDDGVSGTKLKLEGFVLDTTCKPIANAWIDFWQADSGGKYDNDGFKLRGHQFTDANGRYTLETIIPGEYTGRAPHIHAKVKARENSPILTVQLFIPGVEKNLNDAIYNKDLLMDIKDSASGKEATFNFVINTSL